MCRCLRGVWLVSACLVSACIDNGGPSAPATSSVNILVATPSEPQLSTTFLAAVDLPGLNTTTPSNGSGSSPGGGGVIVVPPVGSTVTNLTNGALLVVGDTLSLVGNELATLGGALPHSVGSIVTLVSRVPSQAGTALQDPNRSVGTTLDGVLSTSLNPLQSSSTLLAPTSSRGGQRPALLADGVALVGSPLQQALAGGLTGITTGPAKALAALTPLLANGAPTTLLAPALAGTSSTIVAGTPSTGVPLTGVTTTGGSMTNSAMTGASMTGASMTATPTMTAPAMTAAPTATATGLLPTVTAPVAPILKGVGTVAGGLPDTVNRTLKSVTGPLGR